MVPGLYRNSLKFHGQVYSKIQKKYGVYPGVETSDQPEVLDVLDAGYTPQGLAVDERRRVRQLRRVDWWFR